MRLSLKAASFKASTINGDIAFNFEDTHVTDRRRIKRLLVVAVIAFYWAHRVGEWQHEQVKPIKIKKHQRPAKSIFRLGLDIINGALFQLAYGFGKAIEALFGFLREDKATPF
ncbi:hypothetical protein [Methylovulum miyakonense]